MKNLRDSGIIKDNSFHRTQQWRLALVQYAHSRKLSMTKIVVLVVEDEPIIRMNAVALIEDAGYDVIEASHADDAILYLETRPDIRVVFSDIEMPGTMDGLKLLHAIRERWPPVVLILASGRVSPAASDMPSETVFLQKPYQESQLIKVLAGIPSE